MGDANQLSRKPDVYWNLPNAVCVGAWVSILAVAAYRARALLCRLKWWSLFTYWCSGKLQTKGILVQNGRYIGVLVRFGHRQNGGGKKLRLKILNERRMIIKSINISSGRSINSGVRKYVLCLQKRQMDIVLLTHSSFMCNVAFVKYHLLSNV